MQLIKCALLALFFGVGLTTASFAAEAVGHIESLSGEAVIIRPGADAAEPAVVGTPVHQQDIVRSEAGGKVKIRFEDDTVVTVGESSTLKITEFVYAPKEKKRRALLTVPEGIFRTVVNLFVPDSRFEVQTATAVASVQGTEWITEAGLDATSLGVVKGKVLVGSSDRTIEETVVLLQGEGTEVRAGVAPTPKRTWPQTRVKSFSDRTALD
ncbi:MAG: hypothetical protein CMM50_08520 [Rhodospirillaceae bacterium]|nr:hypothetical protein [Rhodospirillaceae bacterium]